MFDTLIHRKLAIPYTLHVEVLRNPRRPKATVVLIHGIGSSTAMWQSTASSLPQNVKVIAVDLLGFGESPKPEWATYDARTQARSLLKTLLVHRIRPGCIYVGHSLGSLVAVQAARLAPRYPSKLILISPPIYRPVKKGLVITQREDVLRGVYSILLKYPKNSKKALLLAKRYYIRRTGSDIPAEINMSTYLLTLESAIINQKTIDHIYDVNTPITIVSGSRDPLIIKNNLDQLSQTSDTIDHKVVKKGGHVIAGAMQVAVSELLEKTLRQYTSR